MGQVAEGVHAEFDCCCHGLDNVANCQSFRNAGAAPGVEPAWIGFWESSGRASWEPRTRTAASDADWQVLMCDIAPRPVVAMIVETMVPQAQLVSLPELVARADIVMLAVPFGLSGQLDYSLLDGKVVLDPMNSGRRRGRG